MLFKPIHKAPLALDLSETELTGILVPDCGQIRAVVTANPPDFVAAAATERVKEGFRLDQTRRSDAGAEIFIDCVPHRLGELAERGDPGTGSRFFSFLEMPFVPICLVSRGSCTGEIGSLLPARSSRAKCPAAPVHLMTCQAIGLLEIDLPST